MKKWLAFGLVLVCVFLFAGCAERPAQGNSEPDVPEETPEVIRKSITDLPQEEKRSLDHGFSAQIPDGAGKGDADITAQGPEGDPDPDFDVSVESETDGDGMVSISLEPEK